MKTLIVRVIAVFISILTFTACAREYFLSSPAIEGKVIEVGTNKPIPNAIVVVIWQGHVGWTGTVCFHVETATSDDNGVYRIDAWKKPSPYGDVRGAHHPVAYKPGYEGAIPMKDIAQLKPFMGTRGERMESLKRFGNILRRCLSPEAGEKNLLPLYRALYEETQSLASTRDEQVIRDDFLSEIETLELGYKEGMRRALERAEKRDRQP